MEQALRLITQAREDACGQVKKRLVAMFNLKDGHPSTEEYAERVLERAVFFAEQFHREHQWDGLPREKHHPLDIQVPKIVEWQDEASTKVLQDEHKMTLAGFFIAIGIERSVANAIVDYIVARDP